MPVNEYLKLAELLLKQKSDQFDLSAEIASLSPLDEALLEALAETAEKQAYTSPHLGYEITRLASLTANQQSASLRLRSLSFWYQARAANHWARPLLVPALLHQARLGFAEQNEAAWLAACDWQQHELSWANDKQTRAVKTLPNTLQLLESSHLKQFSPYCRLSLATNQIYLRRFTEAQANIRQSETYFEQQNDLVGQAQCWLVNASLFRSQNQFEQAKQKLDSSLEVFSKVHTTALIAKTCYQYGLNLLFGTTDLGKTIGFFEQADALFQECDLTLWHGICLTFLGAAVLQDGQLEKAEGSFIQASQIFQHNHTTGLLADNYTTHGLFNLSKGNAEASIALFQKAVALHKRTGKSLNVWIDTANLGKAYAIAGRYQDALFTLEKAAEALSSLGDTLTLADSELNIAFVWFYLREFHLALDHLQQAEKVYQINQQNASLTTASNLKARIYFEMNEPKKSLECLQHSLERSMQYHLRPQAALAHRLIGEMLVRTHHFDEALEHMWLSLKLFSSMGMLLEAASCHLTFGSYYLAIDHPAEAGKSYLEALKLSHAPFDEINWRACAGLAELAERRGDFTEALNKYRDAIYDLGKIRNNFWQAELSGIYAGGSAEMFARAIPFSIDCDSPRDTLNFIEADKATSLVQQFGNETLKIKSKKSRELHNLVNEINWLQNQLRVPATTQNSLQSRLQNRQIHQQLAEKSKQYDEINARLERHSSNNRSNHSTSSFDIALFRDACHLQLGDNWLALDYYSTGSRLILSVITPSQCLAFRATASSREQLAFETCKASQQGGAAPEPDDLRHLGHFLFPAEVLPLLTPDTTLIISPHSSLHGLPWNALQIGNDKQALVESCVPVITPSLHSLTVLWHAAEEVNIPPRQKGVVVGISSFFGKHADLPFVKEEMSVFLPILAYGGVILEEEDATWQNLLRKAHSESHRGLTNFAFLHLASHFFSDSISGRLSGLALWGMDIYQDQLRDLAPLPEMVTLSGCSSLFTRTYSGDEHISLPTTCLAAGAKTVVGSSWPVQDQASVEFMSRFYHYYTQGFSPAAVLALTQREFIKLSKPISSWAGYCCIGKP